MNQRNKGIDILRAFSLISVIIYHLYEYRGTYLSVLMFFVISGYLVTASLMEKEENYFTYVKKRVLRIFPPLVVVVLFSLLMFYLFSGYINQKIIGSTLSSIFAVSNIYQILSGMSYFERSGDMLPLLHTWTLSIELQFYVFYPFLIFFLKKIKNNNARAFVLFLLSLVSAGIMAFKIYNFENIDRIYYGTDTRIFSILIGGFFYFLTYKREYDKKLNIFASISLMMFIVSIFAVNYSSEINYYCLMYLLSILSGIMVVAAVKTGFLNFDGKIFKIFEKLGEHSYSYYLWQYPIMVFSMEYFKWANISYLNIVLFQILILIILAEISFHFLEKRIKMAKYLGTAATVVYLVAIFFLPFSTEANSETVKNRVEEIERNKILEDINFNENTDEIEKNYLEEDSYKIEEKTENNIEDKNVEENKTGENIDVETENVFSERDSFEDRILDMEAEKTQKTEENKDISLEKIEESENRTQKREEIREDKKEEKEIKKVPEKKIEVAELKKQNKIIFIGDSVMKMGEPYIKKKFGDVLVDAKVSRQFTDLPKILEKLKSENKLTEIVVVHLGTNGVINEESFDKSMKILSGKKVYFINCVVPKFWEKSVNKNIKQWAEKYPNTQVIDWYTHAKGKKELFYKDATHPRPIGAEEYTNFIYKNVNK